MVVGLVEEPFERLPILRPGALGRFVVEPFVDVGFEEPGDRGVASLLLVAQQGVAGLQQLFLQLEFLSFPLGGPLVVQPVDLVAQGGDLSLVVRDLSPVALPLSLECPRHLLLTPLGRLAGVSPASVEGQAGQRQEHAEERVEVTLLLPVGDQEGLLIEGLPHLLVPVEGLRLADGLGLGLADDGILEDLIRPLKLGAGPVVRPGVGQVGQMIGGGRLGLSIAQAGTEVKLRGVQSVCLQVKLTSDQISSGCVFCYFLQIGSGLVVASDIGVKAAQFGVDRLDRPASHPFFRQPVVENRAVRLVGHVEIPRQVAGREGLTGGVADEGEVAYRLLLVGDGPLVHVLIGVEHAKVVADAAQQGVVVHQRLVAQGLQVVVLRQEGPFQLLVDAPHVIPGLGLEPLVVALLIIMGGDGDERVGRRRDVGLVFRFRAEQEIAGPVRLREALIGLVAEQAQRAVGPCGHDRVDLGPEGGKRLPPALTGESRQEKQ